MEIVFRDSCLLDCEYIAPRLAEDDMRDIGMYNISALETLRSSVSVDGICKTAVVDGEPIVMFGVRDVSLTGGCHGIVWQLGTPKKYELPLSLIKVTREFFSYCLTKYDTLFNWFAEYNKRTEMYLLSCGARLRHERDVIGADGNKYTYFYIDNNTFKERVEHVYRKL